MEPKKIIYFAIGMLTLFASFVLLSFLTSFQQVFKLENALSNSSPVGILVIFGLFLFGSIYLLNSAVHILKSVVKWEKTF